MEETNGCIVLAYYKCIIGKKLSPKYLNEERKTIKDDKHFTSLHYVLYMTCEKRKTER